MKNNKINSISHSRIDGQENKNLTRRAFINGFAKLTGAVVASTLLTEQAVAVALAYSPKIDSSNQGNNQNSQINGKLFNQAQLHLLKDIAQTVIPKTDTLGAGDVDVHGFIDDQLFYCGNKTQKQAVFNCLKAIEKLSRERQGKTFSQLSESKQLNMLNDFDLAENGVTASQQTQFKQLKLLICFGYYTSEVGASVELRYDAIPGGFKGSIPYKKTDPSWGSLGLYF